MKFYKRAWLSVVRQKGKSLILFLITLVLAIGIILSFLIKAGINDTKTSMKKSMNLTSSLLIYGDTSIEDKKKELIDKLGASPYINYFDYTQSAQGFIIEDSKDVKVDGYPKEGQPSPGMVEGVLNSEFHSLKNKSVKLVEGRSFSSDEIKNGTNLLLVSQEFAKLNNLKVGQKVKTKVMEITPMTFQMENFTPKYLDFEEFEIIGIIKHDFTKINLQSSFENNLTAEQKKETLSSRKSTLYSQLITTSSVVDRIAKKQVENMSNTTEDENGMFQTTFGTPIYVAKDSDSLKNFVDEANSEVKKFKDKYSDKVYQGTVLSDMSIVEKADENIKSISNLSNIIFIVLIVLSVVVLALVVTLFLRDRRYEFGIYMALGEKKGKTVGQLLIETLIIGMLAFSVAFAFSGYFGSSISKAIISSETVKEDSNNLMDPNDIKVSDFIPTAGAGVDLNYINNNYKVSIGASEIISVYLIGIVTLSFATIIPMIYVLRLNPRKILM